jgi:hypothetical protein
LQSILNPGSSVLVLLRSQVGHLLQSGYSL